MARVRRGEAAALAALYDRHAARMLGLALRMVGQRDAAEAILADAFVWVWERAGEFDPARGEFASWLAALVQRGCLIYLKQAGARMSPIANGTQPLSNGWPALARLPDDERQVVELALLGGLSQREMAARLGRSESAIAALARSALNRLREWLTPTRSGVKR